MQRPVPFVPFGWNPFWQNELWQFFLSQQFGWKDLLFYPGELSVVPLFSLDHPADLNQQQHIDLSRCW